MSGLSQKIRSELRRQLLPAASYRGTRGEAWFAGFEPSARSIAAFFCGDDLQPGPSGRVWHGLISGRMRSVAGGGGLGILKLPAPAPRLADWPRSIAVPSLVDIHTDLPPDLEALHEQLLTSTTREDFRRIRKANFSYRITSDPDAIREFHARHYTPMVAHQFPEDGRVGSVARMLGSLRQGGELVCADIDGDWVAGIFNISQDSTYALMTLGIRDADEAVRQKRVVAALMVRSLERAVELGRHRATLGRSLPFLGKGPVWFKAKWSGTITRDPATPDMHMFMDLRHDAVRRMLSASPIIHRDGDDLVVSTWLDPGEMALKATTRDAGRFPGISRWYVLAEPGTLAGGASLLGAEDRIVPVPVNLAGDRPLWLGEALAASDV